MNEHLKRDLDIAFEKKAALHTQYIYDKTSEALAEYKTVKGIT